MTTALRQASTGRAATVVARFGLAARAVVYLIIGWLAIDIARGHGRHQANQRGALATVARRSDGAVLLGVLGAGLAAYALWRLSEAVLGTGPGGDGAGARLRSLVTGIVYAALSASAFELLAGRSKPGQSQQQASLTARVMRHTDGRWLVGAVGVIVALVGLGMLVEGLRRHFEKRLRMAAMSRPTRRIVVALGTVGNAARGLVVALAGALTVDAAVTFNPAKSAGLDGALRALADRAFGPELLGAVAVGLLAFGLYACAEARWAKT